MKKNELTPLLGLLPTLRPDELADSAAAAVRELLAEAASANTTRSYASALRYWAAWFQGRYGVTISLPVPEAAVVQFVVDHLARRGKAGMAWELPPALDEQLMAAQLQAALGPVQAEHRGASGGSALQRPSAA